MKDPHKWVYPIAPTGRTTAAVLPPNGTHSLPEFVIDRRVSAPTSRNTLLRSSAAMPSAAAHGPAVVDRIHDDFSNALRGDAVFRTDASEAAVSARVLLEQANHHADALRVDRQEVRRLRLS